MSERVTRDELEPIIIDLFVVVSRMSEEMVSEDSKLKKDLLLSSTMIGALAHSYTQISKSFGGKSISIAKASKVETVGEALDLVYGRANS